MNGASPGDASLLVGPTKSQNGSAHSEGDPLTALAGAPAPVPSPPIPPPRIAQLANPSNCCYLNSTPICLAFTLVMARGTHILGWPLDEALILVLPAGEVHLPLQQAWRACSGGGPALPGSTTCQSFLPLSCVEPFRGLFRVIGLGSRRGTLRWKGCLRHPFWGFRLAAPLTFKAWSPPLECSDTSTGAFEIRSPAGPRNTHHSRGPICRLPRRSDEG